LHLGDGSVLACDEILWTTRAAPAAWLQETGLALDEAGFIRVSPTLESVSHGGVFAAGDVATVEGYRLPRSGVHAVRQGPVLADNLRRALRGQAPRPYRPQRDALYIVSTGERHALAHPQRLRGRGRLGLAGEGLDRPALHAPLQRPAGDGRPAERPDGAARMLRP
jgi:selenide,water dikinase